jgi:hypothetical protein
VRIPHVTAGDDPNGMFRLALKTRGIGGDTPRRIVLEGRIGFSRLTGGIRPESQLFVNPEGSLLITGQPGRSLLVHTNTLQTQPLRMPDGLALANAEFASDGAHLAISLLDVQKKQGSVILADGNLGSTQSLPAGTQFLRWLDTDRVLLAGPEGLLSHSISGGEERNLGRPPGKTGNVIPGTEIQFSMTEDGQVLIKNGAAAFREVLHGAKVTHLIAVANDLSLFGGVDGENRLWVQHGMEGQPEAIATGVATVLWGPISRKVLVADAEHRARIYDGRDGSWKDLGVVAQAEWSADEESLLFVEGTGSDSYLSLLSRKTIQKLCPISRMGQIVKMSFSADKKRAFLLASLSQQLDVWMMPLPPPVPLPPGRAQ